MSRSFTAVLAGAALSAALALVALPSASASGVSVLSGTGPTTTPFPDDQFTVADASQATGRRIALPTAGCDAQGRSLCDDLALLNLLDGFDLQPRVTIPFSGPVDLLSPPTRW